MKSVTSEINTLNATTDIEKKKYFEKLFNMNLIEGQNVVISYADLMRLEIILQAYQTQVKFFEQIIKKPSHTEYQKSFNQFIFSRISDIDERNEIDLMNVTHFVSFY